jgi:16S rRNA (guanine966-N2)-methyltransferase
MPMRIVAGTHRGRRLETPPDDRIRPTSDRIREAVFNIVGHRLGGFEGLRVLDGFAGAGGLGLEALSRGAAAAMFVDRDRDALALCRRNAAALGLDARSGFLLADLTRAPRAPSPFDLVLLDPPYGEGLAAKAMRALDQSGWLAEDALLVIESDRGRAEAFPDMFAIVDTRYYGRTRIDLVVRSGTL